MSPIQLAHAYALVQWNGLSLEDAIKFVQENSLEEVAKQTYANDSIDTAIRAIELEFLNGKEINREYLEYPEIAPRGYFKELNRQIMESCDNDRQKVLGKVINCLALIHDNWVATNAKKYSRGDNKLFQHVPLHLIGLNETVKDLTFLAPILEQLGVHVGENGKDPYAGFIGTEDFNQLFISKSWQKYSNEIHDSRDLLNCLISYKPLHMNPENEMVEKRWDYMKQPDKLEMLYKDLAQRQEADKQQLAGNTLA